MKKVLKWLGIVALAIVLIAGGGVLYIKQAFPKNIPVQEIKIEHTDSALVKRGEYLANNVMGCIDCHSERNLEMWALPRVEGTEGKGGMHFPREFGLPGDLYAKNVTPAGIKDYTDAEFYHLLTTGIRKNGEPIFPLMPYPSYAQADPDDIKAIIAYMRTLKPIENKVPESELDFPVNLIVRTIPKEPTPTKRPPLSDTVAYGKYMVTIAACGDCHTPRVDGQPDLEMAFSGGNEYHLPWGTVRSANITPDIYTGIGSWSKQMFLTTFREHGNPNNKTTSWKNRGYQTVMGWYEFAGMTDDDLSAIYTYLKTLKPIKKQVVKWTPGAEEKPASAMR